MLPTNTTTILMFLLPGTEPEKHYSVGKTNTTINIEFYDETAVGQPQPTEQEIIDAGNDLTTVNGQVFSAWYAENGGDPVLTFRRQAKEALDAQESRIEGLLRAMALVILDELNAHAAKMKQITDTADDGGNIASWKSAIQAITDHPTRTAAQIRTAIKNKLDAGDADT